MPFAAVESIACCRTSASSYAETKFRIRSEWPLPALCVDRRERPTADIRPNLKLLEVLLQSGRSRVM